MTQAKHTQQDKIQWIMGFVHEYAKSYHYRMSARVAAYDDADQKRDLLESKLRELVREPLSMDDANKLWDDCLKKHKRPGPYELITEFCNITNTSGVE